jgi:PEP-CTERM motif
MRNLLTIAAATLIALTAASPVYAGNGNNGNNGNNGGGSGGPTLHGFCSLGNVCVDNQTNTPTSVNPPVFAFSSSGQAATGTLWIDILVPNTVNPLTTGPFTISPFTNSGTLSGTANLFSQNAWMSGQLDTYLGIAGSPTNPIGGYLTAAQAFQPTALGFFVYQVNLGSTTLLAQSNVGQAGQDNYLMQLGQSLIQGSFIVGFLDTGSPPLGATANSGAILITSPPPPPSVPEPATWAMMLFGFAATGVAIRRSRRRKMQLLQIA